MLINDSTVSDFHNMFLSYYFHSLINKPTRVNGNKASTVVAIGQCLQYYFYSICKYMFSVHNTQQRRHFSRQHTVQEVALYTVYCEYIRIL